jgi:hypothetical protein
MKMQHPEQIETSVSVNGITLSSDKRGVVDVPEHHVEDMKSHGFVVFTAEQDKQQQRR